MDNTKDDSYYLKKIIDNVEFIIKHTKDVSKQSFEANELLQDSMMFRLIQLSENAANLSDEFKSISMSIPWFSIKGLRNRIVHEYGNVDLTIVYDTIKEDIPEVNELLKQMLNDVF